jgi:hypothetical protein
VVNGDTIVRSLPPAEEPEPAAAEEVPAAVGSKRPAAEAAPDSAAAKRTRRFLGSLLVGTLARAKKEASAFQVGGLGRLGQLLPAGPSPHPGAAAPHAEPAAE